MDKHGRARESKKPQPKNKTLQPNLRSTVATEQNGVISEEVQPVFSMVCYNATLHLTLLTKKAGAHSTARPQITITDHSGDLANEEILAKTKVVGLPGLEPK